MLDRFRTIGPPPAPTPEPRLPLEDREPSRESAAGVLSVPCPERRASGTQRRLSIPPPGQRERRARADRRHLNRRKSHHGSPYGTERRGGVDDRQADRRDGEAVKLAGIGLTRDYFAQAAARPAAVEGTTIPAHLLVRFSGDGSRS